MWSWGWKMEKEESKKEEGREMGGGSRGKEGWEKLERRREGMSVSER